MAGAGKALYEKGVAREEAGDVPGAFEAYRLSAKADPRVAAPYVGLARILTRNHQRAEAIACLKRAAACEPSNADIRSLLGRTLALDGQLAAAKNEYEAALRLDKHSSGAALGLAGVLEDLGERAAAAEIYQSSLRRNPLHAESLAGLLGVADEALLEKTIATAQARLEDAPDAEAALIGYALGKALARRGMHDEAFAAWSVANASRRRAAGPFDRAAFDTRIDRLIEIFSADFFAARRGWGNPSNRPVFIVGLPRSGTTLTEQILAGHRAVYGAGELDLLTDMATGTPDRLGRADPPWPDAALDLNERHVAAIARDHLDRLNVLAPVSASRVVDKQPLNFWHLGLVAVAFPNARIVHCTRDLRDNGLSVFAENFTPEQRWATDLSDIAHYWRGYRRLMQHWRDVAPVEIIENRYEKMIGDPETAARRLIDFLELAWDEECLAFHESGRAVQTPSRWQVRQPVYKTSVERWRRYEPMLGALAAAQGADQP